MLYFFLIITAGLWMLYFYRKDESSEKLEIRNMDGYIVTAIIAALSAKGVLVLLNVEDVELSKMSLGEIEDLVLAKNILSEDDWYTVCTQIGNDHSYMSPLESDLDMT